MNGLNFSLFDSVESSVILGPHVAGLRDEVFAGSGVPVVLTVVEHERSLGRHAGDVNQTIGILTTKISDTRLHTGRQVFKMSNLVDLFLGSAERRNTGHEEKFSVLRVLSAHNVVLPHVVHVAQSNISRVDRHTTNGRNLYNLSCHYYSQSLILTWRALLSQKK